MSIFDKVKKSPVSPSELDAPDGSRADSGPNSVPSEPVSSDLTAQPSPAAEVREIKKSEVADHISPPPAPRVWRTRNESLRQAPYEPVQVRRDERGRILPGQPSINPKGRPLGFVEYIRWQTGEGQELVDHALLCLRGSVMVKWQDENGNEHDRIMPADPKYQAEARVFLKESGFGKALQAIEIATAGDGEALDYTRLSVEETRNLMQLMDKATTGRGSLALQARGVTNDDEEDGTIVTPPLPHEG